MKLNTVTKEARTILFVVGMARSGTSLLAELLFTHFDHGMGPEGSFIPEFFRKLRRYGDLQNPANLDHLVRDVARCEALEIARSTYPVGERFDVSPELILTNLGPPTYSGVVRSVLECMATAQGRSRLGTKLPMFWKHIELLEDLFGESARYLWIVRDGRDVALSLMKRRWGEKSVYACAHHWVRSMESLHQARQMLGNGRLLIVKYENLLTAPDGVIDSINEFIEAGLSVPSTQAIARQIRSGELANNHGKWQNEMKPDEVRIFEALASRYLDEWGYELASDHPQVSSLEHVRFSMQEWLRRLRQAAS
jgi:hypothetical protein